MGQNALKALVEGGVTMVMLRTTGFFDVNAVVELARMIRAEVPGAYELESLHAAGFHPCNEPE